MIVDNIRNFKDYCVNGSLLNKGFQFLIKNGSSDLPDGRINIEGDECFALVQSYVTSKPEEKRWEAHNTYIDIQYIVKGSEIIGYNPRKDMVVEEDQTPKADMIFFKQCKGTDILMNANNFAVFFPQDGHKPCLIYDKPEQVKKIVVKVKYKGWN